MNSLQNLLGLSFSSKSNNIQSSFQTAHDKAVTLISKMNDKISEKEEEVKKIQSEIKDIENIKAQANKFVDNLKSILVMYRIKETFEYLVDDCNDFCSVHDALEMDTDMPCGMEVKFLQVVKKGLFLGVTVLLKL